jgi:hypothetical protein
VIGAESTPPNSPNADDIRAVCGRIRHAWSSIERQSRWGDRIGWELLMSSFPLFKIEKRRGLFPIEARSANELIGSES